MTTFQTVKVEIDVEVAEDAADGKAEQIVTQALYADDRIKLVTSKRSEVLIER